MVVTVTQDRDKDQEQDQTRLLRGGARGGESTDKSPRPVMLRVLIILYIVMAKLRKRTAQIGCACRSGFSRKERRGEARRGDDFGC